MSSSEQDHGVVTVTISVAIAVHLGGWVTKTLITFYSIMVWFWSFVTAWFVKPNYINLPWSVGGWSLGDSIIAVVEFIEHDWMWILIVGTLFAKPWNFRSISVAILIESHSDSRGPYFYTEINSIFYHLDFGVSFPTEQYCFCIAMVIFWKVPVPDTDIGQIISSGHQEILTDPSEQKHIMVITW